MKIGFINNNIEEFTENLICQKCMATRLKKTKIICTLGPSTDDDDILQAMIVNGMNVARFNFSHGTHEEHKKRAEKVRKIAKKMNVPIALLLDTKGPEIRLGCFKNGKVELKANDKFILTTKEKEGDEKSAYITYKNLPNDVEINKKILIDDGKITFEVIEKSETEIVCKVINDGVLSDRKSINVPDTQLKMKYISDIDKEDIKFGIINDFDFIAASFVRNPQDLIDLRNVLNDNKGNHIGTIAKIENKDGVKNIDEIIKLSDGVMVARGDMGVEIDFEELPIIQKMIIQKCCENGKIVITATQMLESMISNPRPTRAEISDVANAVYDGSSAVMLSGETASGKYPDESVKTMTKIVKEAEKDINYIKRFGENDLKANFNVSYAISEATCNAAHNLDAKAIIAVTKSGKTAQMISSFKPKPIIIATTLSENVQRKLVLSWGVYPIIVDEQTNCEEIYNHVVKKAVECKYVKNGDLVIITGSSTVGVSGTTNTLKIRRIGSILLTGSAINSSSTSGKALVARNEEEAMNEYNNQEILVIPKTSHRISDFLKKFKAIILEEDGLYSDAAAFGMAYDIPVIHNAKDATNIIKTDQIITVDSNCGVVYEGLVNV